MYIMEVITNLVEKAFIAYNLLKWTDLSFAAFKLSDKKSDELDKWDCHMITDVHKSIGLSFKDYVDQ